MYASLITNHFILLAGLALFALMLWGWSALRILRDARGRSVPLGRALGYGFLYALYPSGYWWGPRLDLLASWERRDLLQGEARRLGVRDVTSIRCPLCGTEIPKALAVDPSGQFDFPSHPIQCSHCDFRLDSCRFCQYFTPAKGWGEPDITHGTCQRYRDWRKVEEAYPQFASRFQNLGIAQVHVPKRIVDSYVPLEECPGATVDPKRLRKGIPGLTRHRKRLIALRQREWDEDQEIAPG